MSHLNGLQDQYGDKGLSIVSVTSGREDKEKTVAFVKKRGVHYAYAYDPDNELMGWFGVRGIPHAVLVDPTGKIVWRGHPRSLDEALLEKTLQGSLPEPIWKMEGAGEVREALFARRFAAALSAADKLTEEQQGPRIKGLLEARVAAKLEEVYTARELGDYLGAQEAGERVARELAGLPEAVKAAEIVAALEKDEHAQRVIAGQIELRAVLDEVATVSSRQRAEGLVEDLESLAGKYPDSIVEQRASAAAQALKRRLE